MASAVLRPTFRFVPLILFGVSAYSQPDSLALSSGTASPGGTVSLSLSLTSPVGSQPAGLEWTVVYPASGIVAVSATAGSSAIAAGKSIDCAGNPGSFTCVLSGLNTNVIPTGVAAVITLTVSAGARGTLAIGLANALGASATGGSISVTGTGGSIVVSTSPILSSLACSPTSLPAGSSSNCTVTLNQTVPSGATVALSSNNTFLMVPASVMVPSGGSSASFTASVGQVSTVQSAVITATLNGSSVQASLTIGPSIAVSSLRCNPASLISGGSSTCTVKLNRSSVNGIAVQVSDNNTLLTSPSSVAVPAGGKTATFTVVAGTIPFTQTATLTASLLASAQTATLTLSPAPAQSLTSISCDQPALVGGAASLCSAQLSQAAPAGGTTVTLTANHSQLMVPSSIQVIEGQREAWFSLTTPPTDHEESGSIVASTPSSTREVGISLLPLHPLLSCVPQDTKDLQKLRCDVVLNVRPSGPVALTVSGSRNLKLPASIMTRPHQSTLSFEAVAEPSTMAEFASIRVAFGSQAAEDRKLLPPSSTPELGLPEVILARIGEPTEFTVAPHNSTGVHPRLSVSGLPAGASFDRSTGRFSWHPDRTQRGAHDVVFSATFSPDITSSAHLKIEVDSGEPSATALVNSATRSTTSVCSAGSVASLLGKWLDVPATSGEHSAVRVVANGVGVPVVSSSATRVEFLCPQLPAGMPLEVRLETNLGQTAPLLTTIQSASPGIFTLEGSSQGIVSLSPSELAAVRDFRSVGRPAQPGDPISIRATGLSPELPILVEIGGIEMPVESVEPSEGHPGVYDVHVSIPAGAAAGDTVPLRLRVLDTAGIWVESNTATIAIESPSP